MKCLTFLVAVVAAFIAYQQYLLSKKKIQLDLFEKRYRIFESIKLTLLEINKSHEIEIHDLRDFLFRVNDASFLFESDVTMFIEEIKKKANELRSLRRRFNGGTISDDENKKYSELQSWFSYEYDNVEQRFVRYLDFTKL